MYQVLVPIDEDEERARAQVEAVRRLPAAEEEVVATLLHVYPEGEPRRPGDLDAGETALELLEADGITVRTQNRRGDPAAEILDVATETGAELVVLGGRKRSPLGSLLFGSVSHAVILDADRPVTVTGASVAETPSHRCHDCGQTYDTDPDVEIETCRRCGSPRVEVVEAAMASGGARGPAVEQE
ncbi:MAG: universal stress protein [Halobacteriaceae archaeon]